MYSLRLLLLLAIMALSSGPRPVDAWTLYPLANPGFESPALSMGSSWHPAVNGWSATFGVGTTWNLPALPQSPAPQGSNFVYANLSNFDLTQTAGTMAAGKRYILTAQLYPLEDSPNNTADVGLELYEPMFSGFVRKSFAAYKPAFAPQLVDFQLATDRWTTARVILDSRDYTALIGQQIRIHISGYKLAIDDVRLEVYDVGEHPDAGTNTYYVSSTLGNDANNGTSIGTPWQSFKHLNARLLKPGEMVLLRRGDEWVEELNLRGEGSPTQPIELGAWGDASLPRPVVRRTDTAYHRAIVLQRPSYWRVRDLECRHAKIGLYLRYRDAYENADVQIDNCRFFDNPDATLEPELHGYELAWSDGIFLGGNLWNTDRAAATVLDGLSITNCEFEQVPHGFGSGWYFPPANRSRIRNFSMSDCRAVDCSNGAFALMGVQGAVVERVASLGGGTDNWAGSTLGFAQNCEDVTIDRCLFAYIDRMESADGVGFDFEGDVVNATFSNNIVANTSGAAVLVLTTGGVCTGIDIQGCTFYRNALNPWNSEINSVLLSGSSGNTGSVTNCGLYRDDASIPFFSNNFGGFTTSGNTTALYDASREKRWWDFETLGDVEGWNGFNDWVAPTASAGALTGASTTGFDPYAQSPPTWINPWFEPYVWVRMSTTTAGFAQVFFITDRDPVWNGSKVVTFSVIADGTMHTYMVDLRTANAPGIITQLRIDPSWGAGGTLAIDHVRATGDLDVVQPAPILSPAPPTEVTFVSESANDGWVLESAAGSGLGGSSSAAGNTFPFGDTAGNARYRSILSFATSTLPDDAVITQARLSFARLSATGSDPWTFGGPLSDGGFCRADMATPFFGAGSGLDAADWQAAPTVANVANFVVAYGDGLTVMDLLDPAGRGAVNLTGRTQFRLAMTPGTDNDNGEDSITIGAGSYGDVSRRPMLRVRYYTGSAPATPPRPTFSEEIDLPAAPASTSAIVLGTGSIQWQWTDSALNETGFSIFTRPGVAAFTLLRQVDANTTSTVHGGLAPNAPYSFGVVAFNAAGDAAPTTPLQAWTLAAVPVAPILSAPTSTTITIDAGADGNPAGTQYAVWCDTTGQWVGAAGAPQATEHWFTLASPLVVANGLAPSTLQAFRLKARNGAAVETALGPAASLATAAAVVTVDGITIY